MRLKYEALDIFSGCGGVSCGLTLAGFKVKAAVEIDKNATDTYHNYKLLQNVNVLNNDICDLSGDDILKAAKIQEDDVYLFAGCPPCQNFSRQNPENKNKTEEENKKEKERERCNLSYGKKKDFCFLPSHSFCHLTLVLEDLVGKTAGLRFATCGT